MGRLGLLLSLVLVGCQPAMPRADAGADAPQYEVCEGCLPTCNADGTVDCPAADVECAGCFTWCVNRTHTPPMCDGTVGVATSEDCGGTGEPFCIRPRAGG